MSYDKNNKVVYHESNHSYNYRIVEARSQKELSGGIQ